MPGLGRCWTKKMRWSRHHQPSMNAAPSEVGSVFSQIHGAQPLHHSVVGPLGDLSWCDVVLQTPTGLNLTAQQQL